MRTTLFCLGMVMSLKFFGQISCGQEPTYQGEGTYYDIMAFGGMGNCSFPNSDFSPFLIGALNAPQYGLADFCGACAEVTGPKGKVVVHIIDQCPECKSGDIDLSPEAFDYLAPRIDGRIKISWKLVPCELASPVKFYIKEGSSQYWLGIQVRNHRNKIEKLEYWNGSAYISLARQNYNYFLASSGLGLAPYKFRITDVYGNQIVEDGVPLTVTTVINGKNQFPECKITSVDDEEALAFVLDRHQLSFQKDCTYLVYNLLGTQYTSGVVRAGETLKLPVGGYILKVIENNGQVKASKIIIE